MSMMPAASRGVSVIVPCRDEARTLLQVVQAVCEQVSELKEVIVVDDGSSDGGPQAVEECTYPVPVAIVAAGRPPRGKGWAVRAGIERARGAVVVIQDADLEYSPGDIDALVKPVSEGRADAVIGSRFQTGVRRGYWLHRIGNRFVTAMANVVHGTAWTDISAGTKALRREVALALGLREDGFGIDAELVGRLAWGGYRVLEVPVSYRPRSFGEGKKLRFWHGLTVVRTLLRSGLWYLLRIQRTQRLRVEQADRDDPQHNGFDYLAPASSMGGVGCRPNGVGPGRALDGARRQFRPT